MKHLTETQLKTLQEKLVAEKSTLEAELSTVGQRNPRNPSDWEATEKDLDIMRADKNEAADAIEEFEEHHAIVNELEVRLQHVDKALTAMEAGTYGICEVSGEPIPLERLEANPAATTRVEHAN